MYHIGTILEPMLIPLAKEMREAIKQGSDLNLDFRELAFIMSWRSMIVQ
jgi:hypothetical protein